MSSTQPLNVQRFGCMIFLLFLASALPSTVLAMANPCDPAHVSVDANGSFVVSPSGDMTGATDTSNLNCTTDAISNQAFDTVKLGQGSFFITEVFLECPPSKNCLLSGKTKASTVVNIVDGSIECEAQWLNRVAAAGITVTGSTTVRYMTLMANEPCAGDGFLPSVIQFTGDQAVADSPVLQATGCANSTMFSIYDRVDIMTTGSQVDTGVFVGPQSQLFPDACQYLLLGTFNGVRNSVDGPFACAFISMQGGARTGMDFFEARNCKIGIMSWNAGQSLRITQADISVDSTGIDDDVAGVVAIREPNGPTSSSVNIDQSTIAVSSGADSPEALGVFAEDLLPPLVVNGSVSSNVLGKAGSYTNVADGSLSNIDVSVTNTLFLLDGANTTAARFLNIDNGTFSSNVLTGNGLAGLEILVPLEEVPVTQMNVSAEMEIPDGRGRGRRWSSQDNDAEDDQDNQAQGVKQKIGTELSPGQSTAGYTVLFDHFFTGVGTVDNVIGVHEGAFFNDFGCNFYLSVPGGGCALDPAPLLQGSEPGLMASTARRSQGRPGVAASIESFRPMSRMYRKSESKSTE